MTIKAFIGKPVLVHGAQWTGKNYPKIKKWGGPLVYLRDNDLYVHTINGAVKALVGDWIMRGTKGEFYPIRPEILGFKYDEVEDPLNLEDNHNAVY